ncbi:porin family protein [Fontisubflavum oceani]|uniref:porin family protein n=1 Tax=Fontisubflavum oceani TaxID=2978973 RepID=UPI0025B3657C|nr:porin family protein [Fontisubflavum oceani]WJY20170.1 porin family protein [Fontisubflavum oceani]
MTFKTFIAAASLITGFTGQALAQDTADTWQGFYGGLQFSTVDPNSDTPVDPASGPGFGIFGGYNHALGGNWVIGGELGFASTTDHGIPAGTFSIENAITARGRVGYALDDLLLYGSLGYLSADATASGSAATLDIEGPVFGLGAEAMLSETVSARVEYLRGTLDLTGPGTDIDVTTDTIAIGLAFHF